MKFGSAALKQHASTLAISRALMRAEVRTIDDARSKFILSTPNVARDGHILVMQGCVLTNFGNDPIATFNHNPDVPIGTWEDIKVSPQDIQGTLRWATRGISEKADEVHDLVQDGVLRACSVSFDPLEYEPLDPKNPRGGQRVLRWELLECGVVSIPSDPNALVTQRARREGKMLGQKNATLLVRAHRHAHMARHEAAAARAILQRLTPAELDESSSTVQVSGGDEDLRSWSRAGAAISAENAAWIERALDAADDCHDGAVRCRSHIRKVLAAARIPTSEGENAEDPAKLESDVEEQDEGERARDREQRQREAAYYERAVLAEPLSPAEDADRRRRQLEYHMVAGREIEGLSFSREQRLADLRAIEARTVVLPEKRKLRTSWRLH